MIIPVTSTLNSYLDTRPVHNLGIELMTSQIQQAIGSTIRKSDILKKLGLSS